MLTINSLELSAAIIISAVVVGGKIVVIVELPLVISKVDSATSCVLKVEICKTESFLIVLAHLSWRPLWSILVKICPVFFVAVVVPVVVKNHISSPEPIRQFYLNMEHIILGAELLFLINWRASSSSKMV